MNQLLFVYGNVETQTGLLKSSKLTGTDFLSNFILVDLGSFPLAIRSLNNHDIIKVYIYQVNDDIIEKLDKQLKSLFGRKTVISSISKKKGYVYYNTKYTSILKGTAKIIKEGDWEKYLSNSVNKNKKTKSKKREEEEETQFKEQEIKNKKLKDIEKNKIKTLI